MREWINDVLQQVQTYDYGDWMQWRYGAQCESEYNERLRLDLDVDGHASEMPEWLERQLHFENIVYVLGMRVRYAMGSMWCRVFGHPCIEVDEGGPDSPWVAWSCACCGDGGHSWW